MSKIFGSAIGVGLTVFVTVLVIGFLLKNTGFHIQQFKIVRGGDVAIAALGMDTSIFLDQRKISVNGNIEDGLTLLDNIVPGTHSVLVFNDARWPWKKNIVVRPGKTTSVKPFLIKKNPSGLIVTNKDSEYATLLDEIVNSPLPNSSNPKTSESGLVRVWADGSSVLASWTGEEETLPDYFCDDEGVCEKEIEVLATTNPIRNVDFYHMEDEIILVAFSNGIFAIEIDKRGNTQNFQPIYKGTELPRFKKIDENTLHVADGAAIFIINL